MPMTPCRTEKVDFSKKKKTNKNKNRITKKTNRQEESPEETKKTRKQQKKQKNKTCIFRSFDFFFFVFFLFVFFLFLFFLGFGFLVFFLFALVLFFFIIIMFFCRTLYSLCCWTQNNMPWSTVGLCIHCIHLYTHISGMIIQQRPMGMSKNPPIHDAGTTIAARPTSG
jgi:cation transport ATPase